MARPQSRRTTSSLAWSLFGLAMLIAAATLFLDVLNRARVNSVDDVQPIELVLGLTFSLVGAVIASRRPENRIGWIFLGIGLLASLPGVAQQYYVYALDHPGLPGADWAAWLGNWIVTPVFPSGLALFLFLLFPDGHLPSPRWRIVGWLAVLVDVASAITIWIDPAPIEVREGLPKAHNPTGIAGLPKLIEGTPGFLLFLVSLSLLVMVVVGTGMRLRRARGDERQQLRWFAYTGIATVLAVVAVVVGYVFNNHLPQGLFDGVIVLGFGIALPVACGIAILKYGLYELDVVISKTLVVGVLAAFVTAIYVGLVVGVGAAVGSRGKPNLFLSILATALIAVAFQPVRVRARRFADRLVYGKRATPYEILSEFSERMAGTFDLEDILPRTARVLAEGSGAARAEVWLRVGPNLRLAATWPPQDDLEPRELAVSGDALPSFAGANLAEPVRHQGQLLGALTVAKPAADPATPAEQKLVADLASQAGLVLRNARLTAELRQRLEELQASRQRIVAAQDQERRRIERNLHDGAQQQLVAMAVKLRMANTLAERDVSKSRALTTQLEGELSDALQTLRDLARGIYPPLLADEGLVAALTAQSRKAAVPVEVEADGIGRYPQEVEAAVYFCCLEALQNVAKYAGDTKACLRLSATADDLAFEVRDDGRGFDPDASPRGSGLTNMADRMGGGGRRPGDRIATATWHHGSGAHPGGVAGGGDQHGVNDPSARGLEGRR